MRNAHCVREDAQLQGGPTFYTGDLKYFICCLRVLIVKIRRDLLNYTQNTSISVVKPSWTPPPVLAILRLDLMLANGAVRCAAA